MFRRADFRLAALTAAFAASALLAAPAAAQFSDSYSFLQAVEKRDGDEATKLLNDNDAGIVNTRHPDTGETALMIVVKRRDSTWLRFLLAKDADPSIADRQGMTPLMHAAMLDFTDGATLLLDDGAPIDQTNRRGETALILAVQANNPAMVRLLVRRGANPDKADHIAGMSARDYARRNDRSGRMAALLDEKADAAARDTGAVFGPK
ncbi:ankyrin repeat domain-containing protein [Sphingopyxis indica]|uniref:Ankyrin repeat-containing protein n=1 Tax=Sphingopyxis indica TaxID=436663 RepID=A0A239HTF0_9SPHN|nr:ankyrin repeat domain-containing protein [Sphingopyxis indica]SNS84511.1 Ankyrin repeat-containing protein [Sphingopyxis indica]